MIELSTLILNGKSGILEYKKGTKVENEVWRGGCVPSPK